MKESVRQFVEMVSKEISINEPIVEIGSFRVFRVPGQEQLANMRTIFTGKQFIGCDMRPGLGVDKIENGECLSFADSSVGTVLILETLEHVQNFFKVLDETYRILKTDGIVIMSSVMNSNIHDYPSDYWRFTPAAFQLLLDIFSIKIVGYHGSSDFPHSIFGIGIKSDNIEKYNVMTNNIKNRCSDIAWLI